MGEIGEKILPHLSHLPTRLALPLRYHLPHLLQACAIDQPLMTAPAQLQQFACELEFEAARIRRLQRKMDRSRRATNPNNFNPNGTAKKGKKLRTYATVTRDR